ncbi:MAG: hypothetical protein ACE5OP_10665 [Candidatus Glassbacteria bacterium]
MNRSSRKAPVDTIWNTAQGDQRTTSQSVSRHPTRMLSGRLISWSFA